MTKLKLLVLQVEPNIFIRVKYWYDSNDSLS